MCPPLCLIFKRVFICIECKDGSKNAYAKPNPWHYLKSGVLMKQEHLAVFSTMHNRISFMTLVPLEEESECGL